MTSLPKPKCYNDLHPYTCIFRAFISWEENITIDASEERRLHSSLEEYKVKLRCGSKILPDPFTLNEGWIDEEGKSVWPSLYFTDIADYFKSKMTIGLHNRLCNEFKQGKAYR